MLSKSSTSSKGFLLYFYMQLFINDYFEEREGIKKILKPKPRETINYIFLRLLLQLVPLLKHECKTDWKLNYMKYTFRDI